MSSTNPAVNSSRTSRKADAAFPVCMAVLMVYGMELYNHLLMGAPFTPATLLAPFSERESFPPCSSRARCRTSRRSGWRPPPSAGSRERPAPGSFGVSRLPS